MARIGVGIASTDIATAVGNVIERFLDRNHPRIAIEAKSHRRARRLSFSSVRLGQRATITAIGPGAARLALSQTINVPVGGFLARQGPSGKRAWPMDKPEGLVFRARTYTKYSGQTIKTRGVLIIAYEKVVDLRRLANFANTLAGTIAFSIVHGLASQLRAQGVMVNTSLVVVPELD